MAGLVALAPDAWFTADLWKFEEADDGSVVVYGVPSTDSLDLDQQIADPAWLREALTEWYQQWGNIREMHQPSAVGVAENLDWDGDTPYLTARIVDPVAVKKVRAGVYKAFSIGVKNHRLRSDPKARGGRIIGGKIVEVTIADRPANDDTRFMIAKRVDPDGWFDAQRHVILERVDAPVEATLAKGADEDEAGSIGDIRPSSDEPFGADAGTLDEVPTRVLDLQDGCAYLDVGGFCFRLPFTVNEAGEIEAGAAEFVGMTETVDLLANHTTQGDEMAGKSATAEVEKRNFDANVGGGVDRDKLPAEDFIDPKGRRDPIVTPKDVEDAVSSYGRNDPKIPMEQFRSRLEEIAKRKGPEFVSALPKEWKDGDAQKSADADSGKTAEKTAALEKAASTSAFCTKCDKTVKIADPSEKEIGGHKTVVGKCPEGHELMKYLGKDAAADGETEMAAEPDGDEKAADAEKTVDAGVGKGAGSPDGGGDGDPADAADDDDVQEDAKEEGAEGLVKAVGGDILKAALLEALSDLGLVDLSKVGRRMAKKRLDAFKDALGQLSKLADELDAAAVADSGEDADGGKAASYDNAGGPHLVSDPGNNSSQLRTQFVACMRAVNELAGEMAKGDGDFGLGVKTEARTAELGVADAISTGRWDLTRAADPDLTKAADAAAEQKALALAESVAQRMTDSLEKFAGTVVERLEKVEHMARPASPPVNEDYFLTSERGHVFNGKAAVAEDLRKQEIEKIVSELPQEKREQLVAHLFSQARYGR